MAPEIKFWSLRASNPRHSGRARMERGARHGNSLRPGYVRDSELAVLQMHLDAISTIVDEEIADDAKAGLLMRTIGYTLDQVAGLGRSDGEYEPWRRLKGQRAARELGRRKGIEANQAKAALWHESVRIIWFQKRGRYPKQGRLRPGALSQLGLAHWILLNKSNDIPNLPKNEQSLIDAFREWERYI